MSPATSLPTSEVALFGRLLSNGHGEMSAELAKYVLTLGFDDEDQARMQALAERNQMGKLTSDEEEALASYVRVGHLLALLHSKARKSLRTKRA